MPSAIRRQVPRAQTLRSLASGVRLTCDDMRSQFSFVSHHSSAMAQARLGCCLAAQSVCRLQLRTWRLGASTAAMPSTKSSKPKLHSGEDFLELLQLVRQILRVSGRAAGHGRVLCRSPASMLGSSCNLMIRCWIPQAAHLQKVTSAATCTAPSRREWH